MWLLIIVVVVLLLRAMQTSQSAAKISMKCTPASNSPTAGDCFKSGNAPVAGVPERGYPMPGPAQGIHCMHTLPIEISFPVAPPPLAITRPLPSPARTGGSVRPIVRGPIVTKGQTVINNPLCRLGANSSLCKCGYSIFGCGTFSSIGGGGGSVIGGGCGVGGGGDNYDAPIYVHPPNRY